MKKQRVDIARIIPSSELVSGKQYYYKSGDKIKRGTATDCPGCGKFCAVNSYTIVSFGRSVAKISIADISEDEIYYYESEGDCFCDTCGQDFPPPIPEEAYQAAN